MTALRFDAFVDEALYGVDGFYRRHGRPDGRGDFVTSPTTGGLFGRCLATYIDGLWDLHGCPERWVVLDYGAGLGALSRSIIAAKPRCAAALELVMVESSNRWAAEHADVIEAGRRAGVSVRVAAPTGPGSDPQSSWPELSPGSGRSSFGGVILANELLDNLAPRVLRRGPSGWEEMWVVGTEPEPQWRAVADPADWDEAVQRAGETGRAFARHESAVGWVNAALSSLSVGAVVVFDYGALSTAELAVRGDWLRTYSAHGVGTDPLASPGRCDITVDIGFDQLPGDPVLSTQAEFLTSCGIDAAVRQASATRDRYLETGAARDLGWATACSTVIEAERLCDSAGLGAFLVAEWRRAERR